jgi:hypothetical protein
MTRPKFTTLIFDNFTGADGTDIAVHVIAPVNGVGGAWAQTLIQGSAPIVIQSNAARMTTTGNNRTAANANCLTPNVKITASVTGRSAGADEVAPAFFPRFTNSNNYWMIVFNYAGQNIIIEVTAGTQVVRSLAGGSYVSGATVAAQVTANQDVISWADGANSASYSSTVRNSETNHGFGGYSQFNSAAPNDYATIDDLRIEAI